MKSASKQVVGDSRLASHGSKKTKRRCAFYVRLLLSSLQRRKWITLHCPVSIYRYGSHTLSYLSEYVLALPAKSATHTPAPTTARTEGSTQRYGSYTVKVLERKLESRTEFPNANPPLNTHEELDDLQDSPLAKCANPRRIPITPRDKNRLLRLRQDPSVASLLNMYDENGRISSTAFSNTPPYSDPFDEVPGRQPVKRSGSTLRQLLGGSELEEHAAEGDISWAERYLG